MMADRDEQVLNNPDDWKTGDEPWTAAQRGDLETLARQAGRDVPDKLTKAEAAKQIDELPKATGRS